MTNFGVIWFIFLLHYSNSIVQTCDELHTGENNECNRPNVVELGLLETHRCQQNGVIRRINQISLLDCVKECFMTSQCTAINYRRNWYLCDINMDSTIDVDFVKETGCVYSRIDTWTQSIAGQCANHTCAKGKTCSININGTISCINTYCTTIPVIRHAVVSERFGAYRNINTGIKHACVPTDSFVMTGRPLSVCRSGDTWDVLLTCVPKECKDRGYDYNQDVNVCLKYVVNSNGSTWVDARSSCQDDGGNLISMTSVEKYNFVVHYMQNKEIKSFWIGLRSERWVTGETFFNIYSFDHQLNYYDSKYPDDSDNSCGVLFIGSQIAIQDESCNIRKRNYFMCEIL